MIKNFKGVGERISKRLGEMGLKQVDVCNSINISKNTMSNYVSGKRIPDTMVIYKLSKFLSVSIEWLLVGEESDSNTNQMKTHPLKNVDLEMFALYHQLTEREKGKVIGYIEATFGKNFNCAERKLVESKNGAEDTETA